MLITKMCFTLEGKKNSIKSLRMHMNFTLNGMRVSVNTLVKVQEGGQQGRRIKGRKLISESNK